MIEILFRIMAALTAIVSFFGFYMICTRQPNFFLGIISAGILSSLFWVCGIFAATGEKDINILLFIGIFTCAFGFLTFFILWVKYELIPRFFNRRYDQNQTK